MKTRYAEAHMRVAHIYAELSYCKRKQVGCVIIKDDRIISIGFNGTPSGWDNCCEDNDNVTKKETLHAEANALTKLARTHESGEGAVAFITCAPCIDCAKLIAQSGISEVFYAEEYRGTEGLDFLKKYGIIINKMVVDS
jgi:dCMP deaminase